MDKNAILNIASRYADIVKNDATMSNNAKEMYLYGSYAKGTAKKHSDIDIAVILGDSKAINGQQFIQLSGYLWKLASFVDERIEPILIDPDDDEMEFFQEIRETGIKI